MQLQPIGFRFDQTTHGFQAKEFVALYPQEIIFGLFARASKQLGPTAAGVKNDEIIVTISA